MMVEIKCPCGLRKHMAWEDCEETDCNSCCPLVNCPDCDSKMEQEG